jgi:diguanylate cyclase (GGDEF)-like protein
MMDAAKYSVLIVDDDYANIEALSKILGGMYEVYVAKDGPDAVETAESLLPDVILLDIIMPDMDGYEVLATLKNSVGTQGIPVIFITGLSDADDERKGLVMGASDYITKPFSPAIVEIRVRNQIKIIEQFRTIERLSMTDQLTDLPNRRSFEKRLMTEWGRAAREREPISILLIDVDKFKNYNDAHGHLQGDAALQSVAKAFTRAMGRSSDFVARWGGEEFITLLPNTDLGGALNVAEHIRRSVEDMEVPCPTGHAAKITVSIGVNIQTSGADSTVDSFISGADNALYKAKETGRDRVCVADL